MAVNTSMMAIRPDEFGYRQARHLLNRAGFGGTAEQVATLQQMGLDGAVDHLVDYQHIDPGDLMAVKVDSDIIRPWTDEEQRALRQARRANDRDTLDRYRAMQLMRLGEDREQMGSIEQWWLGRMISTPRPMEEKLALLWHGHFASNHRTVRDSYLMLRQNMLFRRNANGNLADLVIGIVRDPAMIKFLNNDSNRKSHPNENLARELMELFTLGEGNYTEDDIREGARALTGYTVDDDEFVFRRGMHDAGQKTILGQRGNFDGDAFAMICLRQRACAPFFAYKLYRHFVADTDEQLTADQKTVILRLGRELVDQRYAIAPVLKMLFKSRHFYDDAIMGNQIKSPAQLIVGTARMLRTPVTNLRLLADAMSMMGQRLFDPPSVAGWAGGRGWINTSTLFTRQNTAAYQITGKLPYDDGWTREHATYDPMVLLEHLPARTSEAVVDHLLAVLLGDAVHPSRREQLVAFMNERRTGVTRDSVLALLLLITAMPEYQLC